MPVQPAGEVIPAMLPVDTFTILSLGTDKGLVAVGMVRFAFVAAG
jgi:hypothetical protein